MNAWQRLQRWSGGDVDVDVFGRLRVFLGIAAICKFIGLTSPVPRLVMGKLSVGLPAHRYPATQFPPTSLGGYVDGWPVPTHTQYETLEILGLVLSVTMTVGLAGRRSTFGVGLVSFLLLVVDPAGFKHNLWALSVFAMLLSLSPCGATHSIDAVIGRAWRRWRGTTMTTATTWVLPLRLLQLQIAVVYLFSTLRKLNDGWSTGHLLRSTVDQTGAKLVEHGYGWLVPVVSWTPWYVAGAWLTVVLEGFLAIGFLVPRWRPFAFFIGVVLHLWIDIALDVGAYSLVMFAAYIAFIEPSPHRHTVRLPRGHRWRWPLRALDWLGRVVVVEHDEGEVVVVDNDGVVVHRGRAALVFVARRLPVTFVPAFIIDTVGVLRRRRQRGS